MLTRFLLFSMDWVKDLVVVLHWMIYALSNLEAKIQL